MSWSERLLGAVAADPAEIPRHVTELVNILETAVASLDRCADLAPTEGAEGELRQLAAIAGNVRSRLREALAAVPPQPPTRPTLANGVSGQNHWARLVSLLEQHRDIRSTFLDQGIALADTYPELSSELLRLAREEETIADQLRDLIARADPQAAN
jgi:hypothetical protein